MIENEIAKIIINTCFNIHVKLDPGLLESVYEEILFYELTSASLQVERQKSIPLTWEDIKMEIGVRQILSLKTR